MFYRLGYPNREVRQSLNRSLLNRMTGDASRRAAHSARLYDLLLVNDFAGLAALFHAFLRQHSRTNGSRKTTSPDYEGYYASVFYGVFCGSRASTSSSRTVRNRGRLDMALRFQGRRFTCSSSRWWSWRPPEPRWRS